MGWTSIHATHYRPSGSIDRKAECDAYFLEGLNRGYFRIEASAVVGSTYYAAITGVRKSHGELIPESEQLTYAVIFPTKVDRGDYWNFSYKCMTEDYGPCEAKCPKRILDRLSPTDNAYALNWRERCRKTETFRSLPVGAEIRVTINGQERVLKKHAPAYQFKQTFWYCPETGKYVRTKDIPEDYEVASGM